MRRLFATALFLACLFGYFAHWKVFEADLFFYIRAGGEILQNLQVQTIDTWSYTMNGKAWVNFEWLSSVISYLGSQLGSDYVVLGWLRSFLVGVWIFLLTRLVQ